MIGLLLSLGLQASTLFSPARPVVPETPPPPRIAPLDAAATRQMSPHVWMLSGYPNIAIVVGMHAALVVDNGLGTPNGQVIASEVQRLAPGKRLYLTTTHFHPEHAAGMAGLPADALLIRSRVQQEELLLDQGRMLQRFRVNNADALRDADYGQPAIVFETSLDLDLGGVHARLLWAGPAHTAGDTLVFVPEDGVLVSGDVVQNRTGPTFLAGGIGPAQWLHTLQAVAALQPQLVIPAHSEPGPGTTLITAQQDFLQEIIDLTHAARARGLSLAQARTEVLAQLRKTHPDWNINPLTGEGVVHAWND